MNNTLKFFAGWLVILVTITILIVPFMAGGPGVGLVCALFLVPPIVTALTRK